MKIYHKSSPVLSFVSLLVTGLLSSCLASTASKPIVVAASLLDSLPTTQFVPTMEHALDTDKNAVYAVSLPLAWKHLRETLGGHLVLQEHDHELFLLDRTPAAENTLDEKDYEKTIEQSKGCVRVSTKQIVSLTFQPAFKRLTLDSSFFGAEGIDAFGTNGAENVLHRDKVDILTYQNEDHFAVRLIPQEVDHEIILYRTSEQFQHLSAMYARLCQEISEAEKAKSNPKNQWRYEFTEFDELLVPSIQFDQGYDYPNLVGKEIKAKNETFVLDKVNQTVSFVLDEKGVSMESEAEIVVNMAGVPDDDAPKPKKLIFDESFFVIVKKASATNPYFVLYLANGDLFRKEGI